MTALGVFWSALALLWAGSCGRAIGKQDAGFAVFSAILALFFATASALVLAEVVHG